MRSLYAVLWLVAVGVAFGLSPPNRPDLWAWILRLLTGDWAGENALVVAHFQMMGLWPLAMVALWRREWRRPGHLPAWPFLLGGFVLGCYAVLPYAIFRRTPALGAPGVPGWAWGVLTAGFLGFGAWGLAAGDVGAWIAAVRTDGFMWPMAWDWLLFLIVFGLEARGRLWGAGVHAVRG